MTNCKIIEPDLKENPIVCGEEGDGIAMGDRTADGFVSLELRGCIDEDLAETLEQWSWQLANHEKRRGGILWLDCCGAVLTPKLVQAISHLIDAHNRGIPVFCVVERALGGSMLLSTACSESWSLPLATFGGFVFSPRTGAVVNRREFTGSANASVQYLELLTPGANLRNLDTVFSAEVAEARGLVECIRSDIATADDAIDSLREFVADHPSFLL